MTKLVECPGCARHVRAEEGRCPFCGRPSTTAAPSRMLALVLPLTMVIACTGGESPSKPGADGGKAGRTSSTPADGGAAIDPEVDDPRGTVKYGGPPGPPPSPMADGGEPPSDVIEPEPEPVERPADKYGAPPAMDSAGDEPKDVIEPEPEPRIEERRKTKYGAPARPRPTPRPDEQDPL